jgi:hypothetical protein
MPLGFLLLFLILLASSARSPILANQASLQDRIMLAANWLQNYANPWPVDDIGKDASFFADLMQTYGYCTTVGCGDAQIKYLVGLIMQQQTPNATFLYTSPSNQNFGWWNAFAVEAIASVGVKMILQSGISDRDTSFFLSAMGNAEYTIRKWQPYFQQPDGSWLFDLHYYGVSGETHSTTDNPLDANAMMLVALTFLASYERIHNFMDLSQQLALWAQRTAGWILSRQERSLGWVSGGFYNNGVNETIFSDSNARAVFGLVIYASQIDSMVSNPEPSRSSVVEALKRWASFISTYSADGLGMHDQYWAPYWTVTRCSSPTDCGGSLGGWVCNPDQGAVLGLVYDPNLNVCVDQYPKESWRAGVIGRALLGIYNLTGNELYRSWANNYHNWLTGNNEVGIDLQQITDNIVLPPTQEGENPGPSPPGKGGFWTGIERGLSTNGTLRTLLMAAGGLETTVEPADFLVRLDDSNRGNNTWALGEFPSATLIVMAALAIITCLKRVGWKSRKLGHNPKDGLASTPSR